MFLLTRLQLKFLAFVLLLNASGCAASATAVVYCRRLMPCGHQRQCHSFRAQIRRPGCGCWYGRCAAAAAAAAAAASTAWLFLPPSVMCVGQPCAWSTRRKQARSRWSRSFTSPPRPCNRLCSPWTPVIRVEPLLQLRNQDQAAFAVGIQMWAEVAVLLLAIVAFLFLGSLCAQRLRAANRVLDATLDTTPIRSTR